MVNRTPLQAGSRVCRKLKDWSVAGTILRATGRDECMVEWDAAVDDWTQVLKKSQLKHAPDPLAPTSNAPRTSTSDSADDADETSTARSTASAEEEDAAAATTRPRHTNAGRRARLLAEEEDDGDGDNNEDDDVPELLEPCDSDSKDEGEESLELDLSAAPQCNVQTRV